MSTFSGDLYQAVGLDEPHLTRSEVAQRSGGDVDQTVRWWRALGFPEVPDGVAAFGDQDVAVVERLTALTSAGLASDESVLRLARLLGSSFARICDAQVATVLEFVDEPTPNNALINDTPSEAIVADRFVDTMVYVWRRHLLAALARSISEGSSVDGAHVEQVVGFADLSGFSKLAQRVSADGLAVVVDTFERTAFDVVTGAGGRAVKLIGDEIMWTSATLLDAVDVALELIRRLAEVEGMPDVHVGIAEGATVALGGDVFGPAVNLAARLTRIARPGSVVIPRPEPDVLDAIEARGDVALTRVRRTYELKGIGDTKITVIRPAS